MLLDSDVASRGSHGGDAQLKITPRTVQNPVLTGFHPDPSILRVGQDYYLATSTFHWWPGVRLHHSRDLARWSPIGYALTRPSQLDMVGVPDHGGIWAPCLSYDADAELFYLVYTVVQSRPSYFDDRNYIVTAKDPAGPWSDPVFVNGVGFDASLFHDHDARKWFVQMTTDPRPGAERFNGIQLQEYDAEAQQLVGPARTIFRGTDLGLVEGPHLYRRDGWYYLLTAEGGTSYEHAVTMARSRSIWGPYEVDPKNPMLTADGDDSLVLQKTAHASLVDTPGGDWYLAHLCGRPLPGTHRCPLGRETAIQQVIWDDNGWLRLKQGGRRGAAQFESPLPLSSAPKPPPAPNDAGELSIAFAQGPLHDAVNTLRAPAHPDWLETGVDGQWLRLRGGSSLESLRQQSLVGIRLRHFQAQATSRMRFRPHGPQQMAGMLLYYDTAAYHYLYVTRDGEHGLYAAVLTAEHGAVRDAGGPTVSIGEWSDLYLRAQVNGAALRFAVSPDGRAWHAVGGALDMSLLSDDCARNLGFTGTYVALASQDFSGAGTPADFESLDYRPGVHVSGFGSDDLTPRTATAGFNA